MNKYQIVEYLWKEVSDEELERIKNNAIKSTITNVAKYDNVFSIKDLLRYEFQSYFNSPIQSELNCCILDCIDKEIWDTFSNPTDGIATYEDIVADNYQLEQVIYYSINEDKEIIRKALMKRLLGKKVLK